MSQFYESNLTLQEKILSATDIQWPLHSNRRRSSLYWRFSRRLQTAAACSMYSLQISRSQISFPHLFILFAIKLTKQIFTRFRIASFSHLSHYFLRIEMEGFTRFATLPLSLQASSLISRKFNHN
jgi:hypothetical protein